jgi:hypothetical protein
MRNKEVWAVEFEKIGEPNPKPSPIKRSLCLKDPMLQGEDVKKLKIRLGVYGIVCDATDIFNEQTDKAVRIFQERNNLKVDGIVGEKTWRALEKDPASEPTDNVLDFVKWVDSPNFKCALDVPCLGWTPQMQADEYVAQAVRDVGNLQMISHANAEFEEDKDGSVRMITIDRHIQPVLTNYPMFIKTLKEIGYKGYINFEFCHMPFQNGKILGYNDYIEKQIGLAQRYLRNLVNNA